EQLKQFFEPAITHTDTGTRTKLRQHAPGNVLPVIIELSGLLIAEEMVQDVAFKHRNTTELAHDCTRCPIPGQDIPTLSTDVGWSGRQLVQDTLQSRTDRFLGLGGGSLRLHG